MSPSMGVGVSLKLPTENTWTVIYILPIIINSDDVKYIYKDIDNVKIRLKGTNKNLISKNAGFMFLPQECRVVTCCMCYTNAGLLLVAYGIKMAAVFW